MQYNENIEISEDFLNSDKLNFHQRKLEIGSLNLDNYNLKLDNHVCKLLYNIKDLKFYPIDKKDEHSIFISSWLNYFTKWDLQDTSYSQYSADIYVHMITNRYYEGVHSIVGFNYVNGRFKESDLKRFIKERNLFNLRFQDFHPIGFLSTEQELKIKIELNRLCKSLDDLVKIQS
jgi:hypothetical protein